MRKLKLAEEADTPEAKPDNDAERIALTERIHAAEVEIERLTAEAARCADTIAAADTAAEVFEVLRKKRAEALASAFVAGSPAVLTDIDAQLATASQTRERAAQDADDARIMASVITERIDAVKGDLASHRADLTRLAREELARLHAEAMQQYETLCEELAGPVAMMYAISEAGCALVGRPGQAINYLAKKLREGLCVQKGYANSWVEPCWLRKDTHYGPEYQRLMQRFRDWGLKP